jgi:RHS repeat-associated protein
MDMEGNWNGSFMGSGTQGNAYKYNGKEFNNDYGLNWYHYGARFYDPAIARWFNADPMSEKHYNLTSYNYVMNNPMRFIDPFGLDTVPANNAPTLKFDEHADDYKVEATKQFFDALGNIANIVVFEGAVEEKIGVQVGANYFGYGGDFETGLVKAKLAVNTEDGGTVNGEIKVMYGESTINGKGISAFGAKVKASISKDKGASYEVEPPKVDKAFSKTQEGSLKAKADYDIDKNSVSATIGIGPGMIKLGVNVSEVKNAVYNLGGAAKKYIDGKIEEVKKKFPFPF